MSKRMIQSIVIFILIGAVCFVALDYFKQNNKQKEFESKLEEEVVSKNGQSVKYGAEVGNLVYDYEMKDIVTGKQVKMSDYRGKKVFLNFWASWCPPCKEEAPVLQRFSEEQDDVIVLGVNVTTDEKIPGDEKKFIEKYGLTFTNVYTQDEMFNSFFIPSFPTSYIIDEDGIILEQLIGGVTDKFLENKFSK